MSYRDTLNCDLQCMKFKTGQDQLSTASDPLDVSRYSYMTVRCGLAAKRLTLADLPLAVSAALSALSLHPALPVVPLPLGLCTLQSEVKHKNI